MKRTLLIAFGVWLLASGQVLGQGLSIVFPADTLYACQGINLDLTATVNGGTSPYFFLWSDGQTGDSISYLPDTSQWVSLTVIDNGAAQATDSVYLLVFTECVWPGDADGNGEANNLDLLTMGQLFNQQGPVRPNAHTNWIGQAAPNWNLSLPGGPDAVHADADGNGIVQWADFQLIQTHYFLPQSQGNSNIIPGGTPLYLHFPPGPFTPGDTVVAEIILGDASHPATNIMGLAFSFQYDTSLFVASSMQVNFANSWLGTNGQTMATISHNFETVGQIDVGLARTDQISQNGYGSIGNIIVAIDDITGKRADIFQTEFVLTHVSLHTSVGTFADINTNPELFQISLPLETDLRNDGIQLGPVPARDQLRLSQESAFPLQWHIRIYDINGKLVQQDQWLHEPVKILDISILHHGIYTISLSSNQQFFTRKFVKQ